MINNENGRSMVEMLGVLAIIGVLSVAGIAGYSMAMKKYRVNEVVNAASQLVVLARAANGGNGTGTGAGDAGITLQDLGYASGATVAGYDMTAKCDASSCTVTTTTDDKGNDSVWKAAQEAVAGSNYYTIAS